MSTGPGAAGGPLVRDARPEDLEPARALTLAAYQEYAPQMPGIWPHYRQNILDTLADPAPAEQIVATLEGDLVGCVLLYPPRRLEARGGAAEIEMPWPEVRLLAVAPAARGRGVGVSLMNECERRARRAGARALTLHTTDLMRAAVRLYQRLGYVRAPDLDFSPAPGVTINGYRLDLTVSRAGPPRGAPTRDRD